MKLKKLAPWNWFKKEEEQDSTSLVSSDQQSGRYPEPLGALYEDFDRLFDRLARGLGFSSPGRQSGAQAQVPSQWLRPSLDLTAAAEEYVASVELPGVESDDVEIELDGDTLVIKGEKRHEHEESRRNYYRRERSYGAFQRLLSLPGDADAEGIDATFDKGLLRIRIPRTKTPAEPGRRIEIRSG